MIDYLVRGAGTRRPRLWRGQDVVSALGVPAASLFTDEVVLAEVRVSDATIEQVRREGQQACKEAAARLASRLVSSYGFDHAEAEDEPLPGCVRRRS